MTLYVLTAELGDLRSRVYLEEPSDDDATFAAMREVLDLAHAALPGDPWRIGRIELRDAETDRLIREMPAKATELE